MGRERSVSQWRRSSRVEGASQDSPEFRTELGVISEELERVSVVYDKASKSVRTLATAVRAMQAALAEASIDMRAALDASNLTRQPIVTGLGEMIDSLSEVEQQSSLWALNLEASVAGPLSDFVKEHMLWKSEFRKLQTARKEFQTASTKFAHSDHAESAQKALDERRRQFEAYNVDFAARANDLEARKTTDFGDRCFAFVRVTHAFFENCQDALRLPMRHNGEAVEHHLSEAHEAREEQSAMARDMRLSLLRRQFAGIASDLPSAGTSNASSPSLGPTGGGLQRRLSARSLDSVLKRQGYLWKKPRGRKEWQRRWFVVGVGHIHFMSPKTQEVKGRINLQLASVRPDRSSTCIFEIITAQNDERNFVLMAANEQERAEWISAIENNIELMLADQESDERERAPRRRQVQFSVDTCADCGAPVSEWIGISFLVRLCIECSGVHRSLGSHISKVRSMSLDKLPTCVLDLFGHVSNSQINSVLEATADASDRPSADAPGDVKQDWITRKYVEGEFMTDAPSIPELLASNSVLLVLRGLSELRLRENELSATNEHRVPLPIVCAHCREGHTHIMTLLMLRGFDPSTVPDDAAQRTPANMPAFCAIQANAAEVLSAMIAFGLNLSQTDASGRSLIDYALECKASACLSELQPGDSCLSTRSNDSSPRVSQEFSDSFTL